jgi:hypothetical protein
MRGTPGATRRVFPGSQRRHERGGPSRRCRIALPSLPGACCGQRMPLARQPWVSPLCVLGTQNDRPYWPHMEVEPVFTDVDADVDLSRSALFERDLALHTGLAPQYLFRTGAKNGRTKLSGGQPSCWWG